MRVCLTLTVVVALANACGGATSRDPADDGGPLATLAPDAGKAGDATIGSDAAEGGAASFDAGKGWQLATWAPPDCAIAQAVDPASVYPELAWVDCDNGISGCWRWDTSSLPGMSPPYPQWKMSTQVSAESIPGDVRFAVNSFLPDNGGVLMITDVAGGPRAAWKVDGKTCMAGIGRLSEGLVPIAWGYAVDLGPKRLVSGTLDELLGGSATTSPPFPGWGDAPQLSKSLGVMGSGAMGLWDHVANSAPLKTDCQDHVLQGDRVVCAEVYSASTLRLHLVEADGTDTLVGPDSDVLAYSLAADASTIAWQSYDSPTDQRLIWKAAWPAPGAILNPSQIETAPYGPEAYPAAGMVEGGWYVFFVDSTTMRALRITDGVSVDVPAPPGLEFGEPIGVVGGEIWTNLAVGADMGVGLLRVPLTSLGVPSP